MLFDTDLIDRKLHEANEKLIHLRQKINEDTAEAALLITQAFMIDTGISEMMVDYMPADELVEFLNHTGEDWVKVGLCGHLMQISSSSTDDERYIKGAMLLKMCIENIKENRLPEFFENEIL